MTNFERATRRMQSQGFRPFAPYDAHESGIAQPSPMRGRPRNIYRASEPRALRIDIVIAVFALGVLLGILIG